MANFSINQFQAPNETTLQFNAAGGSVVFAQVGTGLEASLRADCFLVT